MRETISTVVLGVLVVFLAVTSSYWAIQNQSLADEIHRLKLQRQSLLRGGNREGAAKPSPTRIEAERGKEQEENKAKGEHQDLPNDVSSDTTETSDHTLYKDSSDKDAAKVEPAKNTNIDGTEQPTTQEGGKP